ncbi:hypothetical protein GCM10025762_29700 [Haloechinothrix salitolerans]
MRAEDAARIVFVGDAGRDRADVVQRLRQEHVAHLDRDKLVDRLAVQGTRRRFASADIVLGQHRWWFASVARYRLSRRRRAVQGESAAAQKVGDRGRSPRHRFRSRRPPQPPMAETD